MHTLGIRLKRTCFCFHRWDFSSAVSHTVCFWGQQSTDLLYEEEKIPIPVSTLVLMIVTITYKLVLVVIGVALTIFGRFIYSRISVECTSCILSGHGIERILCNSDADPGISSSACKRHHGKGTCPYRENAFDEAAQIKT